MVLAELARSEGVFDRVASCAVGAARGSRTAWTFLRAGALVMPPALVLAVSSVLLTNR